MPKGYPHLTRDQRCQLWVLKSRRASISLMASYLGIHRSTIYREIKRNEGELGYRYEQAHRKAQDRRYKANHLEILRVKTRLNHFSLKYKRIVRANQMAFQGLRNLQQMTSFAHR